MSDTETTTTTVTGTPDPATTPVTAPAGDGSRPIYPEGNPPVLAKSDPAKPQNTNALRYALKGASNRDSYLINLDAADCVSQYNASKKSKQIGGKEVRFAFVIVGGTIEGANPDGTARSISGGQRVAGWSQDGGNADSPGWEQKLIQAAA